MDYNEKRALDLINRFNFNYTNIPKQRIINLLNEEYNNPHEGSSEYLRLLCGYLCCIGNKEDALLIKKIKYGLDMDTGCMIDSDFIIALEKEDKQLIENIKRQLKEYYQEYFK